MRRLAFPGGIRLAIGLALIIEGVDKFYNKLTEWPIYTAPQILDLLPVTHTEFLQILGIGEVIIGIVLIFSARIGGLLAAMLMFGIVANLLLLANYYNLALLNLVIALTSLSISHAATFRKPPPIPPPIV